MLLTISILLVGMFGWYHVDGTEEGLADVGIGFNDSPPNPPGTILPNTKPPYDNTPKGGNEPSVTKRPVLPKTGEMMTHLGILISGMIVIILMFIIALDKQIQLSDD